MPAIRKQVCATAALHACYGKLQLINTRPIVDPLKASWSSNVRARYVAYPDVTVRGYSCPVTNENVSKSNTATTPGKYATTR